MGLQLKTVREGFPIAAAKTGMLFSAEIIEAVEAGLQGREFPLVVDPVCVKPERRGSSARMRSMPCAGTFCPRPIS